MDIAVLAGIGAAVGLGHSSLALPHRGRLREFHAAAGDDPGSEGKELQATVADNRSPSTVLHKATDGPHQRSIVKSRHGDCVSLNLPGSLFLGCHFLDLAGLLPELGKRLPIPIASDVDGPYTTVNTPVGPPVVDRSFLTVLSAPTLSLKHI